VYIGRSRRKGHLRSRHPLSPTCWDSVKKFACFREIQVRPHGKVVLARDFSAEPSFQMA
jgi:hypothetical protein